MSDSGSCVTINIHCGGGHPSGGRGKPATVEEGPAKVQGIPRFDRFRFANGSKDVPSGKRLNVLKYTPVKGATDGTQVNLVALNDQTSVNHVNTNSTVSDEKPDKITMLLTPQGAVAMKAEFGLSSAQIANGHYIRRCFLELVAASETPNQNVLNVEYLFGNDDPLTGLPNDDNYAPTMTLAVTAV